jgi:hypothetical protein
VGGQTDLESHPLGLIGGASDSVVNSIRLCLHDVDYRVGGAEIVYEDLDDSTAEHGSWLAEKERENARYAAADPDVLAYIGTLDADAAPHSLPILNRAGPLVMISPCNTYPGLTKPVRWAPEEPDGYYPTGVGNYARTVLTDDLQAIAAAEWASEVHRIGLCSARHRALRARRRRTVRRRLHMTRPSGTRCARRHRGESAGLHRARAPHRSDRTRCGLLRRRHPKRRRSALA